MAATPLWSAVDSSCCSLPSTCMPAKACGRARFLFVADEDCGLFQKNSSQVKLNSLHSFHGGPGQLVWAHYVKGADGMPGVGSSGDQPSMEWLWQEYFGHPTRWWDEARQQKYNFRTLCSKQDSAFCMDDLKRISEWVKDGVEEKEGFQSEGSSYGEAADAHLSERVEVCTESHLQSLCKAGRIGEAMDLLERGGVMASKKLYAQLVLKCTRMKTISEARRMHKHLAKNGLELDSYIGSGVVDMYVKCGSLVDALQVHEGLPQRNEFSWTALISGYVDLGQGREALEMYDKMREQGVKASTHTFCHALKACTSLSDWESARKIHAHIIESGNDADVFVGNKLLNTYAKCGGMVDAWCVFGKLPHRDVVSWNVMILGFAQTQESEVALQLYTQMQYEGVAPDERTYVGVLKACSSLATREVGTEVDGKSMKLRCLEKGRMIHAQLVAGGIESNSFVGTSLIDMYVKCGSMVDACHLFDQLPRRDVVSWNIMILGYAQREQGEMALQLYAGMQQEGVVPDDRTFVGTLKACSSLAAQESGNNLGRFWKMRCLERGRSIHSQVVKTGLESDPFVKNTLIDMYAKCGSMIDAQHIFDRLSHHDVVSWNAMILGYAEKEKGEVALRLYTWMQREGTVPDDRTFVGTLRACGALAMEEEGIEVDGKFVKMRCLEKGRAIHSQVVEAGFESDVFVGNTVIDMYTKCGSIVDACHVFDKLPHRDVVSYAAIILGYAQKQKAELGFQMYARMQEEGVIPNDRVLLGALKMCGSLAMEEEGEEIDRKLVKMQCLEKGRTIHAQVVRGGYETDSFVATTLIDMYVKCGSLVDARHVFDNLPHPHVASWNVMILAYAELAESGEAFELYRQMQEQGVATDSWTFVSILKACGNAAALQTGRQIHSQMCRAGLDTADKMVATALVDMYCKCGSMGDAQQVFDALPTKDLVTWSALIAGYARQGESEHVFCLLDQMKQQGIEPDGITFVSVLTVCSHAGLVEMGHKYFSDLRRSHCIVPTIEHYTCMVDLCGRAGQLDVALAMVERMPLQPNLVVWMTLLGSCRKWTNVRIGRHAFESAVGLDEKHAAAYMLMSNIYAVAGMWDHHTKIQVMREKAQAWKQPGQSWWTEVGGIVHSFVVGDTKHPQSKYIYAKLKQLSEKMVEEGYV